MSQKSLPSHKSYDIAKIATYSFTKNRSQPIGTGSEQDYVGETTLPRWSMRQGRRNADIDYEPPTVRSLYLKHRAPLLCDEKNPEQLKQTLTNPAMQPANAIHGSLQKIEPTVTENPQAFREPNLSFFALLQILRQIRSKTLYRHNVCETFPPPTMRVWFGQSVPLGDEDDYVEMNSTPFLELRNPEICEAPAPALIVSPNTTNE